MKDWRTDKPQGSIILAKLTERYVGCCFVYDVLHYDEMTHKYYDACLSEVPQSAIEKWALIEE